MTLFVTFLMRMRSLRLSSFKIPPPTHIYTLSLHDALPIYPQPVLLHSPCSGSDKLERFTETGANAGSLGVFEAKYLIRLMQDRKSTRLNSSHTVISYAVFCLKKKIRGMKTYNWEAINPDMS